MLANAVQNFFPFAWGARFRCPFGVHMSVLSLQEEEQGEKAPEQTATVLQQAPMQMQPMRPRPAARSVPGAIPSVQTRAPEGVLTEQGIRDSVLTLLKASPNGVTVKVCLTTEVVHEKLTQSCLLSSCLVLVARTHDNVLVACIAAMHKHIDDGVIALQQLLEAVGVTSRNAKFNTVKVNISRRPEYGRVCGTLHTLHVRAETDR